MRSLKIKTRPITERDLEIQKLKEIAKTKQLSYSEETELLNKIRSGDRESIERLVESGEVIILSVAKQIQTEIPIEELIAIGKDELKKLAEQEICSETRERVFRFGAWYIRVAILKRIKEIQNKKEQ